jgi:hypothetical protein
MSLLLNQCYANPDSPLWLPVVAPISKFSILSFAGNGTLPASGTFKAGSYTFPTNVNCATLQGWIALTATSPGSTTVSVYLTAGTDTAWTASKATKITGITAGTGTAYIQVDNLQYYSSTPFTTINLMVLNESTPTPNITPTPANGTLTYSTTLPGSRAMVANTGATFVLGG